MGRHAWLVTVQRERRVLEGAIHACRPSHSQHRSIDHLGGNARATARAAIRELGISEGAALAVAGGRVLAVGRSAALRTTVQAAAAMDAGGRAVIPGLVDPHTHLPWAGHRAAELRCVSAAPPICRSWRPVAASYAPSPITHKASLQTLVAEMRSRLDRMLDYGTTTAEAKTGYGLSVADELKQLDAIAVLQRTHSVDLAPTFLGGARGAGRSIAAVPMPTWIWSWMKCCPRCGRAGWRCGADFGADWPFFCDVFCEDGAFDLAQTRRILEAAQALGFRLKLHVDEFAPLGGTPLAVALDAVSVDHIVTTPPEHVALLATSKPSAWRCRGRRSGWHRRSTPPAAP